MEIISRKDNVPSQYKLLILNANGEKKGERFLPVIDEYETHFRMELLMSVTKDGMIVICCKGTMYICDSANIKKDDIFTVPTRGFGPRLTVTNKNEIILTLFKFDSWFSIGELRMYIITMDGKIKREVKIPGFERTYPLPQVSVVFNHVNETIFVSNFKSECNHVSIYIFSNTGEFLRQFDIPLAIYEGHGLVSHPNGLIALFKDKKSIMIQM